MRKTRDSQEVLPKSLLTSCQSDLGEKITPSCKGIWGDGFHWAHFIQAKLGFCY